TSVPSSRVNAPVNPSRTSSWSSTMSTWSDVVSVVMRGPSVGGCSCGQGVGWARLLRCHRTDAVEAYGDDGAARAVVDHLQGGVDEGGALPHDLQAVRVVPTQAEPVSVVADRDLGAWGSHAAGHADRGGTGVPHGVRHRLLRDPEQLALD